MTRERYVYAPNGDLSSVVLRDGRTIAFTYDKLGRLTKKQVPDAGRDVTYAYDLLGRLTKANLPGANAALSLAWTYDKAGRVRTATGPYGRDVTHTYGANFGAMDLRWPDSSRVRYTSDALGRVTAITDPAVPETLATYAYDELSRRTAITRGDSGTTTSYAYDAKYRLSRLAHDFAGTAQDFAFAFAYNEAGEMEKRGVNDPAYEITAPDKVRHVYRPAEGTDKGGNGLNQYDRIEPGPTTLSYDLNGNLTKDADPQRTRTFGYDAANRLVSADDATLAYDAIGRLAEVRQGTAATRFLYDSHHLIGEYRTDGSLLRRTVQGPAVNDTVVVYGGSSRTWLYGDERGSIVALANAAGKVTATTTYGPFGEPGADNRGRFGYTGQVWLSEIGLGYFRARIHSPSLGRFLQTDPIGEAGGMNLYQYASNDPINLVDPDGLQSLPPITVTPAPPPYTPPNIAAIAAQAAINAALRSVQLGARLSYDPTPVGPGFLDQHFISTNYAIALRKLADATGVDAAELVLGVSAIVAFEVESNITREPHGNSSLSQRPTEVYNLINNSTGAIDKIDITSNPALRYSQAWLLSNNLTYDVVKRYSSRYPAILHENISSTWYRITHGNYPRLNRIAR